MSNQSNIFTTPSHALKSSSILQTPFQSSLRPTGESRDLEELIGSLGIDLFSPVRSTDQSTNNNENVRHLYIRHLMLYALAYTLTFDP